MLSAFLLVACGLRAQYTKTNDDPNSDFKLAKELYQQNKFSLAYPLFKSVYETGKKESNIPVTVQLEAKYYAIVSGLQLNDKTAVAAAQEFVDLEHNTPRMQMMNYHLAEYYFRVQDFDNALTYYENAAVENLSNSEIANMKFHQGYALFTKKRFAEAKPLFSSIAQIPEDPNYYDANYYYGFILFSEKKYSAALNSFKIVEEQPTYNTIIPYYLTEIYYYTGDKDKALEQGESIAYRQSILPVATRRINWSHVF